MGSFAPDDWNWNGGKGFDGGRAKRAGKLGSEGFETGAELRIADLPEALAQFLGHSRGRGPHHLRSRDSGPALPKGDLVDRFITEEAIDPLDDQRGEMLDQRRVGALDVKGQRAASLL